MAVLDPNNGRQMAIQNLINGNLKAAKAYARHFSGLALIDTAENDFGFSLERATAAARYLKAAPQSRQRMWDWYCSIPA